MTIEVRYFEESKFLSDLENWKNLKPPPFSTSLFHRISPHDQSWNYYFKPKYIQTIRFEHLLDFDEISYHDPNSRKGLKVFDIDDDLLIQDLTEYFYSFKSILRRDEIMNKNCLEEHIKKSLLRHLKLKSLL